ncbi:hypothetical protein PtrCC142_011843, partial [Pyrenophora tritici-repentis]
MRRKRKAKAASHGPADNASNNGEKKPESGSQNANSSSSSTSKPSANNPNAPSKDLASQMRKMVIEAADPPPNPIPNGKLRRRLKVHWPCLVEKGDPEGWTREHNLWYIQEEMKREEQVTAAFTSLKEKLEQGKKAYTKYFLPKIDNMDFAEWDEPTDPAHKMNFYDPSCRTADNPLYKMRDMQPSFGDIDIDCGGAELRGSLKKFTWPEYASLDPIIVKTTGRSRRLKMWFTGDGFMRMELLMGSKDDFRNECGVPVIWSGIEMTEFRSQEEAKEWRAERKAMEEEEEKERKAALVAAEKKKQEERAKDEAARLAREKERKKILARLREMRDAGEITKTEERQ